MSVRARAPGRVNLIGEHTDYNDGFVLPCAIPYDTRVAGSARRDRIVTVISRLGDRAAFDLDALPPGLAGTWRDYVRGVLGELLDAGIALHGADLQVDGSVPIGAGLSSSASFEIALVLAMVSLADADLDRRELARLAQRAETRYVGTRCGIMDQIAVLFARAGHALFLDTRSLHFEHVRVPAAASVLICNTMVQHELASSAYNERRSQCEESVRLLQQRYPGARALRDVSVQQLEDARNLLPPPLLSRARHVVRENERVVEAARALREGDLDTVGRLMYASHESLRDEYAVSCPQLDTMVELAQSFDGVIGARMTGGGFGGCTVNVVRAERAQDFRRYVVQAYQRETGVTPEVYDGTPSSGADVTRE